MLKSYLFSIILFLVIVLCSACEFVREKGSTDTDILDNNLTIAAAADLKFAMDSLVKVFKAQYPDISIDAVYGSSGKFYQQIVNDAPFDLYFSADAGYPQKLVTSRLAAGDLTVYAIGRIVIYSKNMNTGKGMNTLLDPAIRKIAIANPVHAPYGKRAEEALRYYKLYDTLKQKLVMGENVAQAAQYVGTGAAEVGIIAQSLVLSNTLQRGNVYLIPEESHSPLQQAFIILKKAAEKRSAFTFSTYISSPEAKQILKHYGFSIP